jgi:hypothetical protein
MSGANDMAELHLEAIVFFFFCSKEKGWGGCGMWVFVLDISLR